MPRCPTQGYLLAGPDLIWLFLFAALLIAAGAALAYYLQRRASP